MGRIYLVEEYKNKDSEILGMDGRTLFMNNNHYCFENSETKLYVVMTRGEKQHVVGEFIKLSNAIDLLEKLG